MSISAMKQALDALERGRSQIIGALVQQDQDEAITALRQSIAEAEKQEPVAWREVAGKTTHYYDYNEDGRGEPLYAAPQPDLAKVGEVGIWGDKHEPVAQYSDIVSDGGLDPRNTAPVAQCAYPQCQATNGCAGACSKEPVAWMCEANVFHSAQWKRSLAFEKNDAECFRNWQPLYAKPQSCAEVGKNSGVSDTEWVGKKEKNA